MASPYHRQESAWVRSRRKVDPSKRRPKSELPYLPWSGIHSLIMSTHARAPKNWIFITFSNILRSSRIRFPLGIPIAYVNTILITNIELHILNSGRPVRTTAPGVHFFGFTNWLRKIEGPIVRHFWSRKIARAQVNSFSHLADIFSKFLLKSSNSTKKPSLRESPTYLLLQEIIPMRSRSFHT